ncbi:MAG: radical SAM protein [Anaerolineae bacterium]
MGASQTLRVLPFALRQWGARVLGRPRLPLSLVASVTYRCNSRCRTCNVWQKQSEEMTLAEWQQVFARLGHSLAYLTFSGGEPFLRRDLPDIVLVAYRSSAPSAITIPTNGLLGERVVAACDRIAADCPASNVGINLSLDGLGTEHDDIRGVAGNWEKALRTWEGLKALQRPNLTLSLHTVVSRFNVGRLAEIQEGLLALAPDSYITEIAEQRQELGTIDADIAPDAAQYEAVVPVLEAALRQQERAGFSAITQAFRTRYYHLAARIVREQRQVIPCYAGRASGHIAPDGDVWTCCTRAEPIGNLRQTGYDLRPIWFGERAEALRRSISSHECACPMANAAYTNMLLDPASLAYVLGRLAAHALGR